MLKDAFVHNVCSVWALLQAEHAQLASVAVPLLLHCLTLPSGPDVFWKLVEGDFNNEDWKARFAAGRYASFKTFMLMFYESGSPLNCDSSNLTNGHIFMKSVSVFDQMLIYQI